MGLKAYQSNSLLLQRFKKRSRVLAVVVIILGFSVLVGWQYDLEHIKRVLPGMIVMNPVSALCFLLSGTGFLLISYDKRKFPVYIFIYTVSFILLIVSVLKFLDFIDVVRFHVDELLYAGKVCSNYSSLRGHMAISTAINFFLLGIVMMFSISSKIGFKRAANYICLLLFLIALYTVVGYIYNVKEFYLNFLYVPMASQSAIAFILISIACWFSNAETGFMRVITSSNSGGTIARILIPATIFFPILLGYVRIVMHHHYALSIELGVTILITSIIFLFIILLLYVSLVINRKDDIARLAEQALEENNAALEQTIAVRTQELSRNEKRFRALIENNSSAISLMDKDFNIIYRSSSATRLTGYTAEERKILGVLEQIHPDDTTSARTAMQDVLQNPGKPVKVFFRIKHKNGHYIWMDGVLLNMLNDKDVNAIIVNMRDVSETVEAEQKMRESNTKLNAIFNNISEGITFIDNEGIIRSFNDMALSITLISSIEPLKIGVSIFDYVDPTRIEIFKETLMRVRQGEKVEYDTPYRREGKTMRWLNVSFNAVKEEDRVIGICISSRDITGRKETEERLAASEKRFRALIENNSDSIVLTNENLKVLYQTPAVERMTGISMELRNSQEGVQYSHPDDLAMIKKIVQQSLVSPAVPIPFQSRLRHVAGHYIWVEGVVTNLLQESGVNAMVFNYRDVTERKTFEEQQALFVSIVNSSDDAILSRSLDGTITSWNNGAEKVYDYTAAEAVGKNISMLIPPDLSDEELLILDKIKRGESIDHYETKRLRKNGEIIYVSLTISPIKDEKGNVVGASKIARDITEQRRAEDKLAANERRFRALIENITDAIVVNDPNFNLIYQSPSVTRILGYSAEERAGVSILNYVHPEYKASFIKLYEELKNTPGHPLPFQYLFLHKNGKYIWLEGVVTNLVHDPSVQAYVANYRDVSDRKRNEEEILKLNTELEERVVLRTEQLQAANKEMESFSYSVSHDLRAPLRIINGYSQILMEDYADKLDKEGVRTLNVITSNATKMGQLIDDLLNFSRLGKAEIIKGNVDMNNIVADVLRDLKLSNIKMPETLIVNTLEPGFCDPSLIRNVWANLLSNAIKYSGAKEHARVEIGVAAKDGETCYFVSDNGAGFDMLYHDKMFGVFQRLHKADEFPGTGVGLAIVHRIVTRHGGRIWANAKINEGATFYFTLGKGE